jgi:hypothetical protein
MPGKVGKKYKVMRRFEGQEYVGHRNNVHAAVVGPPCLCRFKCFDIVSPEESIKMRNAFYSLHYFTSHRCIIGTGFKAVGKKHVNMEKNVQWGML